MNKIHSSKLELHYFFGDDLHQMDAVVRHQCEGEVLRIIDELNKVLHVKYKPLAEAYAEGGLKEFWSFTNKHPLAAAAVTTVITGVLVTILSTSLTADKELVQLQKENLKLDIELKKIEIQKAKGELQKGDSHDNLKLIDDVLFVLSNDYRVIRARSNFYKNLETYQRVTKISGQQIGINNEQISQPVVVERRQFRDFILHTDDLPSETDDAAIIEVISPVLKQGNFKWRGIYKEESIDFYMKDSVFKNSVFGQKISFTNGISLKCALVISRKINEIGDVYVSSYSVGTVISYTFGNSTVETLQGEKYFRAKKENLAQLSLFE